jgi:acetyl/propionyl-CoA carboxylase alpha subunit
MSDDERIARVLVAVPGLMAVRLARAFRAKGIETVVAFSEADASAWWVEEADFEAYLNGRSASETYLHAERLVSAAMDAGCDALHPGDGPMNESIDLVHLANNANVAVLGGDPKAFVRCVDRGVQRAIAERAQVALIPATGPLGPDDDGMEQAASLGAPLLVRSTWGTTLARSTSTAELPAAVVAAREAARQLGHPAIFVQREGGGVRATLRCTVVASDRHGAVAALGDVDTLLEGPDGEAWLQRLGPTAPSAAAAQRLMQGLRWPGLAAVRWSVVDDVAHFIEVNLGLSAEHALVEAAHGIDLVEKQFDLLQGSPLGWAGPVAPDRAVFAARVCRVGDADEVALTVEGPEGVVCAFVDGDTVGRDQPRGIMTLLGEGETEQDALGALSDQLQTVVVDGLTTNLAALRARVASLAGRT